MQRKSKLRVALALAVGGALVYGSLAGAADPSTESKLASARAEAERITGKIRAQSAEIAELEERAAEAAARERELTAQLEQSTERSNRLASQAAETEDELRAVRARYKRSLAILSQRLVEIYKGSDPDYVSVILESDGFEDLSTRAEYLDALADADNELAERVSALHDEVTARYEEIAALKAEIDRESQRLEGARREIASIRASAHQRAAELERARAEAQAALDELQSKILGWEQEIREQAAQDLKGAEYVGGPYAIPTYIVMCESGGNYSAYNPSSGAGGAYQILPSTWRAYGGTGLPHQASKAEQDRIAAAIWADSGPSAWSCA